MRRARSQVDADGATVTTRSRNDGMSVHGTARSRPGGTTTTGPSPSSAAASPSNEASSAAPLCFSASSSPGCGRPRVMRRSTKRFIWTSRSGTLPTVCRRTRRSATTTACSTLSTVMSSISVFGPSSSKSPSRSNSPSPGLWLPGSLRVRAWTAASSRRRSRSRAFRREAAISVSPRRRLTLRSASSSAASSLSSLGRCAPGGQRGRPPSLAPEQQPADVAAPERVALGQRGELGAVRRAVRAQLGGPEPHLVLLEGVEPARAGGDGGPGVALRVGLQRPGEPGHAASQRRPTAA